VASDREWAETFAGLAGSLYVESAGVVADRVVRAARELIPGCEEAALCVPDRHGGIARAGSTGVPASAAEAVWHESGDGPCRAAIRDRSATRIGDLLRDPRFPAAGREIVLVTGLRCVLAVPLTAGTDICGALTVAARSPEVFGPSAAALGRILATHAGLALACANARRSSRELAEALEGSRLVGMALGIVMARRPQTPEQAFGLLRRWSQRDNRKVREVAEEIVATGRLPEVPQR